MPVIGGNNPTVQVTVPVPKPAPMKAKPQPKPQPAPQPVPDNAESQQQPTPQGLNPSAMQQPMVPQQPEPRAILFPWSPAPTQPKRKLPRRTLRMANYSRKYASSDDDFSMDFDSMGEDQLPRAPLQRPQPAEDITGRTRKQILQQMLDAAKKGHYDPSGMAPHEIIQDMENKEDTPQFGGDVWMSDPEDEEEPKKFARLPEGASLTESQGDGYKITTPHGYIDYRHNPDESTNEIWWVESHKKGHGSQLVDLMQMAHPAGNIGWGVTTPDGKGLRDKWHAKHPEIGQQNGAFEGQFDPSGDNYGEDSEDEEFDDEEFDDEKDDEMERYNRVITYPRDT